jgi:hypothetical protein
MENVTERVLNHHVGNLPDTSPGKKELSRSHAAVALRIAGATYADIAQTLGYQTPVRAAAAVEMALAGTVSDESREGMRVLEGQRLEGLLRSVWGKATNEQNPDQMVAVRTALSIIDRHARLFGLDAPQEMVVYTPAAQEIEAWVAQMAHKVKGALPQEADVIDVFPEDEALFGPENDEIVE